MNTRSSSKGKGREVSAPIRAQTKGKGEVSVPKTKRKGRRGVSATSSKVMLNEPSDNTLSLTCLIEGDDDVFEVTVAANKPICHLMVLIREKGIEPAEHDILAKALKLLKVDINLTLLTDSKLVINESEEGVQELKSWSPVSHFWPTQPAVTNLHVFVKLPTAGADRRKQKAAEAIDDFEKAKSKRMITLAPSDTSKPSVYRDIQENDSERILDDRPSADLNVPPASLLYSGFGHFSDVYDGCNDVPYLSCIDFRALQVAVDDFADEMGEFFENQAVRRDQGLFLLNAIFSCRKENAPKFEPLHAQAFGNLTTDGHNLADHDSSGVIVEFKNKITGITSVPEIEATAYVARLNVASKRRPEFFGRWRVPCLGLTVVGHRVTFYGIILMGHQYRLVSLAPTLSCLRSSSNSTDRSDLCRAFAAASVLDMHIFKDVRSILTNPPPHIPPSWRLPAVSKLHKYSTLETMDTDDPEPSYFEFQIQEDLILVDSFRLLFLASTTSNEHVVIKFTRRYCAELHALCAKLGRAPQLLAFERLPGGWFGVAMEYIAMFTPLSYIPKDHVKRPCWQEELQELMTEFHGKNLVHGDLRDVNIIVNNDEQVLLVDFDWGGEDGKTAYPKWNLNAELLDGRAHNDLKIRIEDDKRILAHTFSKSS